MSDQRRPIPIYTTSGDLGAYLVYPYLYNKTGEWIGWLTPEREVYSVYGRDVGWLSDDPRILRKRSYSYAKPDRQPPSAPLNRLRIPSTAPLPPLMPEFTYSVIDVLDERPELLPTIDDFAYADDMD